MTAHTRPPLHMSPAHLAVAASTRANTLPFYIVLSDGDPALVHGKPALLSDIRDCQIEGVRKVIEVIADEGTCRDVTEDIAIDIANAIPDGEAIPLCLFDFIESRAGFAYSSTLRIVDRTFSGE